MQFELIVLKSLMKIRYAAVIQHSLPRLHKKRKWISSEVKTHDVTQGREKQRL